MANNKSAKLPKRIAGVKIPKPLRKAGGSVQTMLGSKMAQDVIEDLITAALLAAAAKLGTSAAARRAGKAAKRTAADAVAAVADVPDLAVGKPRKTKAKAKNKKAKAKG
jgi:hypothetical protein